MARRLDAVVCDLDGTLIESAPELAAALNEVLAAHGRPGVTIDAVKTMIGDGIAKLVERGFIATGAPLAEGEIAAAAAEMEDVYAAGDISQLFPRVVETLDRLRGQGCKLAVCTNKPLAPTLHILESLGIRGHFASVVGGDSLGARKPDPAPLLAILDELATTPGSAVMVGDSANDVIMAQAAGVTVIAVSYGYAQGPVGELGADGVIAKFSALPIAITALGFE